MIREPSNCCKAKINTPQVNAGINPSINKTMKTTGIPPINGPKYGIILVTKITKANNGKNGNPIKPKPTNAIFFVRIF